MFPLLRQRRVYSFDVPRVSAGRRDGSEEMAVLRAVRRLPGSTVPLRSARQRAVHAAARHALLRRSARVARPNR